MNPTWFWSLDGFLVGMFFLALGALAWTWVRAIRRRRSGHDETKDVE